MIFFSKNIFGVIFNSSWQKSCVFYYYFYPFFSQCFIDNYLFPWGVKGLLGFLKNTDLPFFNEPNHPLTLHGNRKWQLSTFSWRNEKKALNLVPQNLAICGKRGRFRATSHKIKIGKYAILKTFYSSLGTLRAPM